MEGIGAGVGSGAWEGSPSPRSSSQEALDANKESHCAASTAQPPQIYRCRMSLLPELSYSCSSEMSAQEPAGFRPTLFTGHLCEQGDAFSFTYGQITGEVRASAVRKLGNFSKGNAMCAGASCNQLRKPRVSLQSQVHAHCPFSSLASAAVGVCLPTTDIAKGTGLGGYWGRGKKPASYCVLGMGIKQIISFPKWMDKLH